MHAFIVRPFGIKQGIDFDRVEQDLLTPALKELNFSGKTTQEFIEQGNIRTDMFEQLLIADLVIADVSIHNANAFYELGIRHAFRDRHTFLIKSEGDEVPFDLKTDRYFSYDVQNPADSLQSLIEALRRTLDSSKQDSPIFQLLPTLKPSDPDEFVIVPSDFQEDVERAEADKSIANLQMLATEVKGFAWTKAGLRLIGQAQFALKDWQGAKVTWQDIRGYDELDIEANSKLGTIYQKSGDLTRSDQALARVLNHRHLQRTHRAEIYALQGSNAKTRWKQDWELIENIQAKQQEALCSPHLQDSLKLYNQGFAEDRNHYYSGLNALAMVTILTTLAEKHADIWSDDFEDEEDAAIALKQLKLLKKELMIGVRLALKSELSRLEREQTSDIWAELSMADWIFLTTRKPRRVGRAYKKALVSPQEIAISSARAQLLFYRSLQLFEENVEEALKHIPDASLETPHRDQAPRVLVFTGHRIDTDDRPEPRFPKESEAKARSMIYDAVRKEKEKADTAKIPLLGVAGGANGGDILFHEVCQELGIESHLYLVLPKQAYCKASVADGGLEWVERFNQLYQNKPTHIFSENAKKELPKWLRNKKGYSIWQRSNLWMLCNAFTISQEDIVLIALWNGQKGDGPGGTEHMVELAKSRGCRFIHLKTQFLIE